MGNKKKLLIIVLAFVLLIVGAYVLYDKLGEKVAPDQLEVETQPTQPDPESTQEPAEEKEGIAAPDFTVYDKNGNEVHLSDYFGKPIVLNFWASWCGPCQMEMPDFQEKYLELGSDVQFLMINMTDGSRETVDTASAFIADQGYTFPVFYDMEADAAMTYGAYSLPTTFFINGEGYAIAQATGPIPGETLQQGIDMITSGAEQQ